MIRICALAGEFVFIFYLHRERCGLFVRLSELLRKRTPLPNDITSPSCAGGSSATIRNSSRRLGLGISRVEDGAASTTTPRCASPPTDSWSPRGRRFPPVDLVPPGRSRNLRFPTVTDPEAPPLRTQRHVPNSIATLRIRLSVALASRLSRCPCCATPTPRNTRRNL